ncbi:MAG: hypothetical protein FWF31_01840 [Desulfobulbus sp.]|nr:hypothetical protein [Desulfobulbus sp.]
MKTTLPLSLLFFCFVLIHPGLTLAGHNLRICGLVEQINKEKNTATIKVRSLTCPGDQKFRLSDDLDRTTFSVGQNRCFVIDSNTCSDTAMHTILTIDKRKGE